MSTSSYHHGAVRECTLDAARQMLERLPAQKISMREVARAAGVSHAAPYKHFSERSDFLAALAARCLEEFVLSQSEAARSTKDPRERLVRLGTAYVEYGLDHRHAFALIFDPQVSPPGDPPPELAASIGQHRALLHDAVEGLSSAGGLPRRAQTSDVAAALWSQVHGLTQLVVLGHIARDRVADILGVSIALMQQE